MKSIKKKADEKYPIITGELQTYNEKFVEGANYALDAIEEFMDNLNFGSNEAEMFHKDLKIIIHKFIEQLKGNQ